MRPPACAERWVVPEVGLERGPLISGTVEFRDPGSARGSAGVVSKVAQFIRDARTLVAF